MATPPKRQSELARPRARKGGDAKPEVLGTRYSPTVPDPDEDWHPIAIALYKSLAESGQSDFYQSSDWVFAYSVCDDLSRYKEQEDGTSSAVARADRWYELDEAEREAEGFDPKKPPHVPKGGSAMKLVTIMDGLSRLAVTEVDRLKVRMELKEASDPDALAEVVAIDDAKKRLGAS